MGSSSVRDALRAVNSSVVRDALRAVNSPVVSDLRRTIAQQSQQLSLVQGRHRPAE